MTISGQLRRFDPPPMTSGLHPHKQTFSVSAGMSQTCQQRTGGFRNRQKHDIDRVSRVDQRRVPIDQSAVGPIASPRLSRRHIGGFTPSAPITTAAASEPSFFITMKTLRPTASWSAGALSKATTVALLGMVIVCSPPL